MLAMLEREPWPRRWPLSWTSARLGARPEAWPANLVQQTASQQLHKENRNLAEASEPAKTPVEPAEARASARKRREARQPHAARGRSLILLIVLVALLGACAYAFQRLILLEGQLEGIAAENDELAGLIANQAAIAATMQARIEQAPEPAPLDLAPLRELERRLSAQTGSLRQQVDELHAAQRSSRAQPELGWKVREASYLLGLANRKLQLEADVAGAIVLFESADQALAQTQLQGLLHIRRVIAGEIAQLRALDAPDRQGILFRLEGLLGAIDELDLSPSLRDPLSALGEAATPAESDGAFAASLEFLRQVFVWRKWEERPRFEAIIGEEEAIRKSLRLRVEQAQLALLLRDNAMYRANLQAGLDQLQRYVAAGSAAALAGEFNALLLIDIAPELPALNESLRLVGEFLAGEAP